MVSRLITIAVLTVLLGREPALAQDLKKDIGIGDPNVFGDSAMASGTSATDDCADSNVLLPGAKELAPGEMLQLFDQLTWKPGVRLFELLERAQRVNIASLGGVTCHLSPTNVRRFIEHVESEKGAMELALYFYSGVVLTKQGDYEALIRACRTSPATKELAGPDEPVVPVCDFDESAGAYRVSFIIYGNRMMTRETWLVTPDGVVRVTSRAILIGPPEISGWDAADEQFRKYVTAVGGFDSLAQRPLERAAGAVLADGSLDSRGLWRARVLALEWLLRHSDVKQHALSIRSFLRSNGATVGSRIRTMALSEFTSHGVTLPEEEIRMLKASGTGN